MAAKKGTSSAEERPAIDVTNVTGAPSTLLNGGGIKKRGGERERERRDVCAAGSWPRDKSVLSRNYDRNWGCWLGVSACRGKLARA